MVAAFAGDKVSAAHFNNIAGIGEEALEVTTDVNSATWNGTTMVLTNLAGTFTASADAKYRVEFHGQIQSGGTAATPGLFLVYQQGSAATISSTICGRGLDRYDHTGVILERNCVGSFVATATGTYGVALLGSNPGGETAVIAVYGAPTTAINRLTVTRVR